MRKTIVTCDICKKELDEETDRFYHCEPNFQVYAGSDPYFKEFDICNDCFKKYVMSHIKQ